MVTFSSNLMNGLVNRGAKLFRGRYGRAPFAPAAPEEFFVEVEEVKLHALRWPSPGNPPLVLIHGLNGNAWFWARVAGLLRPIREVVVLTMRGHGQSTKPESEYGLDATGRDLCEALDRLGYGRVDLAGHSWGGKIALHFAANYGHRLLTLSLADPVPPAGFNLLLQRFPGLVEAAFQIERGPFANDADWETAFRRLVYFRNGDDLDWRIWKENFQADEQGIFHHQLTEAGFRAIVEGALQEDIRADLWRIGCPVLLMRPTFTVSFLPFEFASLRAALPNLREARIWGDHCFIHSNSLDTAALMGDFLAHHDSR